VLQILSLSAPRTDGQGHPAGESTIYLYPSRGSLRTHFVLKTRVSSLTLMMTGLMLSFAAA